jgi:ankyrin repeat protein
MLDLHRSAVDAIRGGDVETLEALLAEHPSLAKARPDRVRTLLHVVADRPGHFPRGAETVVALARAGAEPDARFIGTHGLLRRVTSAPDAAPRQPEDLDRAFWYACHGGSRATAELLLNRGADVDHRPSWEDATPLDAALRTGAADVAEWLRTRGARRAAQLRP